jgi:hypothetical protein
MNAGEGVDPDGADRHADVGVVIGTRARIEALLVAGAGVGAINSVEAGA